MKVIIENKKARYNYHITDTYECGLVLQGSEVKSLREKQCSIAESYVSFKGSELFLEKAMISEFKASSYNNHKIQRSRKLLLHSHEILKLNSQVKEKGVTLVPMKLYFKAGKVKLLIGLGKGKKNHDKRQDIKEKDMKRNLRSTGNYE